MPYILDHNFSRQIDSNQIIGGEGDRFYSGQHYPRPLRERHLVELSLHRLCLLVHNGDLVSKGCVGAVAGSPHLVNLLSHYSTLFSRIVAATPYGGNTYEGSGPQPENLRLLPAPLALVIGGVFITISLYLLNNSFNGADYRFYAGVLGSFLPFAIGAALILFCFLPNPPTVFGFSVRHFLFH